MFKFLNFFSKYQDELNLLQELLGVAIAHTKKHNTLTAISEGISTVEGLSGASGAPTAPSVTGAAVPPSTPFNAPGIPEPPQPKPSGPIAGPLP